MLPAANEMQVQLDRLTSSIINETYFEFTIADFLNVTAAETLVRFLIYGSAVSQRATKYSGAVKACDNAVCRDLGLMNWENEFNTLSHISHVTMIKIRI